MVSLPSSGRSVLFLICSVGLLAFWRIYPGIDYSPYILSQNGRNDNESGTLETFPQQIPVPDKTIEEPSAEKPRLIIIVAHLHSGSTYIGSLFQKQPGTFYQYEPLRNLLKQSVGNDTAMYLNGEIRKLSGHVVDAELAAMYTEAIVTCNHDKLDLTTLIRYFHNLKSEIMRDVRSFFKCQERTEWFDNNNPRTVRKQGILKSLYYTKKSQKKVRDCLPYLTNNCLRAKIRVSKLIHIGLDSVEIPLKNIPHLKVIHLFRDPRSMMDSIMRKHEKGVNALTRFKLESKRLCERMRKDITMRKLLHKNHPGNIMGIRYEDFSKAPLEATKALFEFTGLSVNESLLRFVRQTSVVAAKNSAVREGVWRGHMDQAHLNIVNTHCSDVMEDLGYIEYDEIADLRNVSKQKNRATRYTTFVP